jgi:hypothetical protein
MHAKRAPLPSTHAPTFDLLFLMTSSAENLHPAPLQLKTTASLPRTLSISIRGPRSWSVPTQEQHLHHELLKEVCWTNAQAIKWVSFAPRVLGCVHAINFCFLNILHF